jgi:hypothetical protein
MRLSFTPENSRCLFIFLQTRKFGTEKTCVKFHKVVLPQEGESASMATHSQRPKSFGKMVSRHCHKTELFLL